MDTGPAVWKPGPKETDVLMPGNDNQLKEIIAQIRDGSLSADDAFSRLRALDPLHADTCEDLGFARVDHSRAARNGFAEVIFCEGKTPDQCARIADSLTRHGAALLATRANADHFTAIRTVVPHAVFHETARVITAAGPVPPPPAGRVAIVSAGTADQPVAEEAAGHCGSPRLPGRPFSRTLAWLACTVCWL